MIKTDKKIFLSGKIITRSFDFLDAQQASKKFKARAKRILKKQRKKALRNLKKRFLREVINNIYNKE